MESFYLLIPIALIFVAGAIRLLFWAINSGQYDNLDTEAHRILFDEDKSSAAHKRGDTTIEEAVDKESEGSRDD